MRFCSSTKVLYQRLTFLRVIGHGKTLLATHSVTLLGQSNLLSDRTTPQLLVRRRRPLAAADAGMSKTRSSQMSMDCEPSCLSQPFSHACNPYIKQPASNSQQARHQDWHVVSLGLLSLTVYISLLKSVYGIICTYIGRPLFKSALWSSVKREYDFKLLDSYFFFVIVLLHRTFVPLITAPSTLPPSHIGHRTR